MRIHVLSDLHLEFAAFELTQADVQADAVVLAGDTDLGARGVDWARLRFPTRPVVYVLGNHEYYRHSFPGLARALQDRAQGTNVHVLEDRAVRIDGVTFLGCTLWSDFSLYGQPELHGAAAHRAMSDFVLIGAGDGSGPSRCFVPGDMAKKFAASRAWLEEELDRERARRPGGRMVVVTHNAPASGSVTPRFAGNPLTPAFVCGLDDLVSRSGASLWIHGHVHDCFDYRLGGTRVLCNPRGYPTEPPHGFRPDLVVEV